MGFSVLTVIFVCMGFGYDKMQETSAGKKAFVFLVSGNRQACFIANSSTVWPTCSKTLAPTRQPLVTWSRRPLVRVLIIVIPGEVFPTRYRSTAHGICAASGKLGGKHIPAADEIEAHGTAIVAQVGFARLINIGGKGKFLKHIMELFAFFM
jgi:PHS family inorganic phosphate transporter-like MFS transporter